MKTSIAVLSGLALVSSPFVSSVSAGDREWATAGKVLTGITAAHILSRAFCPPPVYQTTYVVPTAPVVVAQPQVVYAPAQPVVVQQTQQPVYAQPAPAVANAPTVAPAPVAPPAPAVTTTTTYVVQQPVYVQQPPVYVAAPTVYAAPVYYAPPPVVHVGFGFGWGHRWHGRGCW